MIYIGEALLNGATCYVYVTGTKVVSNDILNMRKAIIKLFKEGNSDYVKKNTLWQEGVSNRLDCQNDKTDGSTIDSTIHNKITSRFDISAALKDFSNDDDYDMRLLRVLLSMTLLSNAINKKIVVTTDFIKGQKDITDEIGIALDSAQTDAKKLLI